MRGGASRQTEEVGRDNLGSREMPGDMGVGELDI